MTIKLSEIPDISQNHRSAVEAVTHAIASLEIALSVPQYYIRSTSRTYQEMRRDMPYVIHETSIPKTQILVNRNYKPVGSTQRGIKEWAKYEDFKNLHVRLAPEQILSVASPDRDSVLFGDGNPPWKGRAAAKEYLQRLQTLLRILKVK